MKRFLACLLCVVMAVSSIACSSSTGSTGNVSGFGDRADGDQGGQVNNNPNKGNKGNESGSVAVSAEILEVLGLSEEEWAAMDPAKQEALLAEMGVVLENNAKNEQVEEQQTKPASQKYTPDDVMSGGSYKVVLGDYMNSITLYYENGKLVRLEEAFQKNDEEAAEYATYEGDSLAEYGFNFIDWANASLQDILDGMKDYGEFGQYSIRKND